MHLKSAVLRTLDSQFRDFERMDPSAFPADEFSSEEAEQLVCFCRAIQDQGYESVEEEIGTRWPLEVVNTAAEYGAFVRPSVGSAYLGIFVLAQLTMEPFASDGYAHDMLRSEVFVASQPRVQNCARFLMLLASLYPKRFLLSSVDEYYGNLWGDVKLLGIDTIDVPTALKSLCEAIEEGECRTGNS